MEPGWEKGLDMPAAEEQDLRQILVAKQHRLTQIDGKIDSLSYRMDRMTECLDKHAERLDQSERRVSEVEDGTTQLAASHVKLNMEVHTLHLKVEDLEARSQRNNLRIVARPGTTRAGPPGQAKLHEFQDTALAEVQHLGKYATANVYGERPSWVLANLIRPGREQNVIMAVQAADGSETRGPEHILARFREYY
ncbi:hypothetical protein NDU88_002293 [Pleurodeles waltl]|uniref:Uncharacterized protein n=1 Tax=Pleurodeles waltl TaxID=8319 RepID=A0AAV7VE62_PLEWA|nr:hypothetical protein NDU88_002293 [Pleurodeles waltl]